MTGTIASIRSEVEQRGITRLCHFTPSRNLSEIADDRRGILASQSLQNDERAVFNPTDLTRLDGYRDHVCCSIQYPNAWYFKKARKQEKLFLDWVVILIRAHYLWRTGTKFCPRNAAAEHGRLIREGTEAFDTLFEDTVAGAEEQMFTRSQRHPAFLPTDEQAEVLIPDQIQWQDVMGIAVHDVGQAKREVARLRQVGKSPPRIVIVPQFYDPYALSNQLRSGKPPVEQEHQTGAIHAEQQSKPSA